MLKLRSSSSDVDHVDGVQHLGRDWRFCAPLCDGACCLLFVVGVWAGLMVDTYMWAAKDEALGAAVFYRYLEILLL
jgi:hypothetical protein